MHVPQPMMPRRDAAVAVARNLERGARASSLFAEAAARLRLRQIEPARKALEEPTRIALLARIEIEIDSPTQIRIERMAKVKAPACRIRA